MVALIRNVPITTSTALQLYYRLNDQAISYPGSLVSIDCSLRDSVQIPPAMARIILTALAPLYIFMGELIILALVHVASYYASR